METRNFSYAKSTCHFLLLAVTLLSSILNGFGQHIDDLKFNVGRPPSPVLGKAMFLSPRFHGRIGGIDFNQVAILDPSLQGMAISIAYNPGATDGSHLDVWIGKEKVRTDFVPDWQLIPIAKFADTEYSSVVSIFGEAIHEDTTEIVYHPAFINTLLGWRLLQSDILLKYPEKMWQLPQGGDGVLSGSGEKTPNLRDSAYYLSISSTLDYIFSYSIQKEGPQDSWVYTDHNQNVTIQSECGRIKLVGLPYHYFTYTNYNQYYSRLSDYFKSVEAVSTGSNSATKTVLNNLQSFFADLQDEQSRKSEIKQDYRNARDLAMQAGRDTTVLWKNFRYELAKSDQKSKDISIDLYDYAQENKQALSVNSNLAKITTFSPVLEKEFLTNMIRNAYPELLQRLNPSVYQATKNTMQLAAFFRYVKQTNPAVWKKFMSQVEAVPATGFYVPTPYEMDDNRD